MNYRKCIATCTLATIIGINTVLTAFAAPAPDGMTDASTTQEAQNGVWETWKTTWESLKTDWTQMSLSPGKEESELNFAWYSVEGQVPHLKIATNQNMTDAKEYVANQVKATLDSENAIQYMSNKVTATGLKENTTYYYSYQIDGTYTQAIPYQTQDSSEFSFVYVGDPQIGSSNAAKSSSKDDDEAIAAFLKAQSDAVRNDTFNWNTTLNKAMNKVENKASFIMSAGDQIQLTLKKSPGKSPAASEIEYTGYLSPSVLQSIPVATTVGNHDADNPNYSYHFNTPNNSELGSNGIVGGDYYFTYGDALFMVLNTQDTSTKEHTQFMEETVAAHKDKTWKIVTMHQDIYGSAEHSNEPEIAQLRYDLVPTFEKNDIDVVLTGHDHAYSRSMILKGGKKVESIWAEITDELYEQEFEKEIDVDEPYTSTNPIYINYLNSIMDAYAVEHMDYTNNTAINPEGILYMTANSSSGSKYYDLVSRKQAYIANRWQEDVPTYSIIDVDAESLTINTYRTDTDEAIDSTFTIKKVNVGWVLENGTWFFYDQEGVIQTGWLEDAGKWYYLAENGAMQTGWVKDAGKWYYLAKNGVMKTGWVEDAKKWYYLAKNGVMQTGWVKDAGKWYYLAKNGVMKTGWVEDAKKWYYLAKNGVMKTGWVEDAEKWYYLAPNGVMKTGWVKDAGKWYYLAPNGAMKTGWIKDAGKWYYLAKNGAMQTGWVKDTNKWYYLITNGSMKKGWVLDKKKWYYLQSDGSMKTNGYVGTNYVNEDGVWVR